MPKVTTKIKEQGTPTMTLTMKNTILALAATASLTFAGAAFAAGGDSDASKPQCKDGQTYDEASKKCVDKSGQLNDDTIYSTARQLAYAGKYDDALSMLKRAKNQNDPRILTYYGFTNRKLGNVDVAMDYYNRAIAADANNLLARSYMGQGLVQEGKLEEARAQLIEIRDRGGKGTYAYEALYEALKSGSTY
jgi:tetratricopeptide (TPR) repeat protein